MKKEDINYELISNIEIKIQDTLFYMPEEVIKGIIILNPKYQMNIKDRLLHLTLKIMQYEFWEYSNIEIKELKNIYTTKIQEEEIEYKIKDELDLSKNEIFESFSIIEKEKEDKIISIPFQLKIDNKKILPTFQFLDKNYILGIRHLLLVECKEYNSSNYIGLFIGKNKNLELQESKEIKETYKVGLGNLTIKVNYPKVCYKMGEKINVDIKTDSNLNFKKITEINQLFYRKIEWVGIMKNTTLDKNIFDTKKSIYNSNKFGLLDKITFPIRPVLYSVGFAVIGCGYGAKTGYSGYTPLDFFEELLSIDDNFEYEFKPINSIIGGIIGGIVGIPLGFMSGFAEGFFNQGEIINEILKTNYKETNMKNKFVPKIESPENKKWLVDNLKKFVFFKGNKIVGFIKFAQNITPPINGYYFKCKYNIKIEVQITGIILNRHRFLKTQIDFYDSDEYIANMKNIFKSEI